MHFRPRFVSFALSLHTKARRGSETECIRSASLALTDCFSQSRIMLFGAGKVAANLDFTSVTCDPKSYRVSCFAAQPDANRRRLRSFEITILMSIEPNWASSRQASMEQRTKEEGEHCKNGLDREVYWLWIHPPFCYEQD